MIATRHVEFLQGLDVDESASLGRVLRNVSVALTETLGCEKTYVVMFAEAPEFAHLHFHVIARHCNLDAEHRGTGVFALLKRPPEE